jgi:hypothetical protein
MNLEVHNRDETRRKTPEWSTPKPTRGVRTEPTARRHRASRSPERKFERRKNGEDFENGTQLGNPRNGRSRELDIAVIPCSLCECDSKSGTPLKRI